MCTEQEYVERARLLNEQGYNCAQAVACAFLDQVSMDEKSLFAVMEGFGAGMGGNDATCGALSGAVAILSLLNSKGDVGSATKASTYALVEPVITEFAALNKSLVCKDLKGNESGMPLRSCPLCIEDAVRLAVQAIRQRE